MTEPVQSDADMPTHVVGVVKSRGLGYLTWVSGYSGNKALLTSGMIA